MKENLPAEEMDSQVMALLEIPRTLFQHTAHVKLLTELVKGHKSKEPQNACSDPVGPQIPGLSFFVC